MASPEQPWTPGGSGDPPSGKGNGEGSSSGQGSARRPVIDLFGTDIAPAAIVLVLVLLGLMKGECPALYPPQLENPHHYWPWLNGLAVHLPCN